MHESPTQPQVKSDDLGRAAATPSPVQVVDKLLLLEETAFVSKRKVVTGSVRVSSRTEIQERLIEVSLDRDVVDITRVPVGRIVDVAPTVRTEHETTIVPIIEERFVVIKQLFLREELHIRRRVERDVSHRPVALRRQVAVVERVGPLGHVARDMVVPEPEPKHPVEGMNQGETHGHS